MIPNIYYQRFVSSCAICYSMPIAEFRVYVADPLIWSPYMICRECGNDNGTIVDTCVACGQSLQASMGLDSEEDMEVCPQCGSTQSRDDRAGEQSASRFCGECGNQLSRADETNLPVDLLSVQLPTLAFYDAMRLIMANYMKFNGRSRRSEYWWFILFLLLLGLAPGIGHILCAVMAPPIVTLSTRRLHDIGKSGWSQLVLWISCIGWIFLLRTGNLATNSLDIPSDE